MDFKNLIKTTFFIITLSYSFCVHALEKIPSHLSPGWNAIRSTTLKTDVSFLASDKLQGRLALQKGNEDAINWIAEQFKKAGLKPLTSNYVQAIPVIEFTPDYKKNVLSFEREGKIKQWKKPDVETKFYQNEDIQGELVFAGYGITAPALHYDDYKDIDVKGKMVLIFEHEPQETDPKSLFNGLANTIHAANRVKALNAQKHGAIAVLIAPEPNRKHPSNQERYNRLNSKLNHKMQLPDMVLADDELQIPIAIISDKVAKEMVGPSISLSQLQHDIDKNYKPASRAIPDVKLSLSTRNKSKRTATSYNVAGMIEGSDPILKDETIIISAHHDHNGMHNGKIWYGADDNASGTAGVVALAQAISTNNQSKKGMKLKRSILFVIFGLEERGLLGSYYMTAHPLRPLHLTRAMINLDMIGRNETESKQTKGLIAIPKDTTNRLNLIGSYYSPSYDNIVNRENQFVGLDLDYRFDKDAVLNSLFRSDQFPFMLHRIPAFWFSTGFHPDYHQTTDTADKLNYTKMQHILQLAYLSSYAFANDDNLPTFVENP